MYHECTRKVIVVAMKHREIRKHLNLPHQEKCLSIGQGCIVTETRKYRSRMVIANMESKPPLFIYSSMITVHEDHLTSGYFRSRTNSPSPGTFCREVLGGEG